jgi:uroporphyrinogen III methyltransferase/synthase
VSEGRVYLVGAGPGDPGLLTLKAARVLEAADVVVYDNRISDAILDRLPARAERVYAGKEAGTHTMDQAAINALLEERARGGQTVVRLKGGDPFVFGRGGEEAEYLARRGIPFEVVPGVTSAIGVPAYAGIPVTHRGVAASFAVVTGRAGPIGEAADIEWEHVAGADTIVVLMGVANHDGLVKTLIDCGRRAETPAAAIRWGTTAQQTVVIGTLATIAARMREAGLRPPAILVVGDVVSLMARMRWAENRPLFGRRVLIPASYPDALTAPLENLGAEVLHVAPLESGAAASWAALNRALEHLAPSATVLFADEDAVAVTFARLAARGLDARALAGRRVVADGESTAAALGRSGVRADLVLDGWDAATDAGADSLLVLGGPDTQAPILADLRRRGVPSEAPALSTLARPKWRADRIRELLTTRPVHTIAFSHATQVRRLVSVLDDEERRALGSIALAASSASAARALREHGLDPAVVASGPAALAEALAVARAAGDQS